MELKYVREFVLNSPKKDWYEKVEFTFPVCDSTGVVTKKGFISVYEFVLKESNAFKEVEKILPSVLNTSKDYFAGLKNDLVNIINNNFQRDNQLDSTWDQIKRNRNINGLKLIRPGSPEANFLINLNEVFPGMTQGAFNYFAGHEIPKDKMGFAGALKAYEFSMDGGAKISRPPAEKATLTKLSKDIEAAVDQSNQLLIDHFAASKAKSEEFAKQIDELKKSSEEVFRDWITNSKNEFRRLSQEVDAEKNRIEATYKDHLTLDAPADYWKKRAGELNLEGHRYLFWLYWFIAISGISLFFLLWQIPEGIFLNVFKGDVSAIKWSIIYISFLTLIAFGIKTLSKLSYSTFHLMRDAEERFQLTHVYLALKKDAAVEAGDRQLILQALFSRAETGLLKDDSSPTMPGLVDSFIRSGGRGQIQ